VPEVVIKLRPRHSGQLRVIAGARRFNVLMCGRRFGKTALGTDLAANDALDGLRVAWFAPSYKLLDEVWRELVALLAGIPGAKKNEQQKWMSLPTGGVIECWTLESGDDVARGRAYDSAYIDEAGLVPQLLAIWSAAIRPTLADREGTAWFLGTPKGRGDFSTMFDWGQSPDYPEWSSWRMSTLDNPFIPPSEIEAMARELPDAVYRQEILGEPMDDADHPIGLIAVAECVGELSTAPPVIWGVDLARAVDYTVAIGLDAEGRVCHFDRWQSPWGLTRDRLTQLLGRKVWARVDSTGVGDPIVEDLQRNGCQVEAVTLSAKSKQNAVERLISAIQQRRIRYPDGLIRGELDMLTAERTAYGVRYQAAPGRHDDCVIALALAVEGWHAAGYSTPKEVRPPLRENQSGVSWDTGKTQGAESRKPQDRTRPPFRMPRRTGPSALDSL